MQTPVNEHGASPAVRARLLDEVRAIARARRKARIKSYALAATLAMAVSLPVWHMATREQLAPPGEEVTTAFYPLRYANVPLSTGHVVRLEVPAAAMTSFGLQPTGSVDATVLADVLVGEDGVARAVRFVVNTSEENVQ
jgi:hypothetical protein